MNKYILLLLIFPSIIFSSDFFDPKDLKKGMKGYALTVFQGSEPEPIDIEVIAFMTNAILPKSGVALIKLSGEKIERTRVAQGMSGSPVYIDGKLLGALAYTWANARELLAGVVPIKDMLDDKQKGDALSFHNAEPIKTAWAINGINNPKFISALEKIDASYPRDLETAKIVPSRISNGVPPLKPGDAVAIQLITGDISAAGIGTVTYVEGENVFIFGHPMDGNGTSVLPLAQAEIYDIMASTHLSFKMGAPTKTIGATIFDGIASVYGRFDREAPMIPTKITVINQKQTNEYNFSIARSPRYLPALIAHGIGSVLEQQVGKNIERIMNLSWNLLLEDNTLITNQVDWVKNSIYDPLIISDFWSQYISLLWNNTVSTLVPKKIELTLNISDKAYGAYILDHIQIPRQTYMPNDIINISASLNLMQKGIINTNISFKIPANTKAGEYFLMVGGGVYTEQELAMSFPDSKEIKTKAALINELQKQIPSRDLQVILLKVNPASLAGATILTDLPPSRRSLFENTDEKGKLITAPVTVIKSILLDKPILGIHTEPITIITAPPVSR